MGEWRECEDVLLLDLGGLDLDLLLRKALGEDGPDKINILVSTFR